MSDVFLNFEMFYSIIWRRSLFQEKGCLVVVGLMYSSTSHDHLVSFLCSHKKGCLVMLKVQFDCACVMCCMSASGFACIPSLFSLIKECIGCLGGDCTHLEEGR